MRFVFKYKGLWEPQKIIPIDLSWSLLAALLDYGGSWVCAPGHSHALPSNNQREQPIGPVYMFVPVYYLWRLLLTGGIWGLFRALLGYIISHITKDRVSG